VADDIRKLLDHIVRVYLVHDDLVSIDQSASANEPGAAIESDKRRVERRELERAGELAQAFSQGLARSQSGAITLDDRDAAENAIADALIHFLVRADLATSRATETEPNHYSYRIAVDWTKLADVAAEAGVELSSLTRNHD
jgi:hypothetical protein